MLGNRPGGVLAAAAVLLLAGGCQRSEQTGCARSTPTLEDGGSASVEVRFDRSGRLRPLHVNAGLYGPVEVQRDVALIDPAVPPDLEGETRSGRVSRSGEALSLEVAGQTVRLTRYFCD